MVTLGIFSAARLSQDCCADAGKEMKSDATTAANENANEPLLMATPPGHSLRTAPVVLGRAFCFELNPGNFGRGLYTHANSDERPCATRNFRDTGWLDLEKRERKGVEPCRFLRCSPPRGWGILGASLEREREYNGARVAGLGSARPAPSSPRPAAGRVQITLYYV